MVPLLTARHPGHSRHRQPPLLGSHFKQWIAAAKLKKDERLKTAGGVFAVADGGTCRC